MDEYFQKFGTNGPAIKLSPFEAEMFRILIRMEERLAVIEARVRASLPDPLLHDMGRAEPRSGDRTNTSIDNT